MQQPREGDDCRRISALIAEGFPLLELVAVLFNALADISALAAHLFRLFQHPAEKATIKRTPRNHAKAILTAGGEDLELDHSVVQVVEALLANEPHEIAL